MKDLIATLGALEAEGSFNAVVQMATIRYGELGPVKPEILERFSWYLRRFGPWISPLSRQAMRALPGPDLAHAGLDELLEREEAAVPDPAVGRIPLAVATSSGVVRELWATRGPASALGADRLALLDRAGAAACTVLKEHTGRLCLWRPGTFHFEVRDPQGRDDLDVKGDSMGLALGLALYSVMTNRPVPSDLSASATLDRDGRLGPVRGVARKVEALSRERWYVKRLMVAEGTKLPSPGSGISLLPVRTLEEALAIAFPGSAPEACLMLRLDLPAEIRVLREQYTNYLFDTCIGNAAQLIAYLESRESPVPKASRPPFLFSCYWKKGCCHCHRGEVRETREAFRRAWALYRRHAGSIRAEDYYRAKIQEAVALKDIFRYRDAEGIHRQLIQEMEKGRTLDQVKGENLSSLSQLYLAQRRFGEAEELQRKAMRLIDPVEVCRNWGYLAQIHTRSGDFRKAAAALRRYRELLDSPHANPGNRPYLEWIRAEYLYRRGLAAGSRGGRVFEALYRLAETAAVGDLRWWVPALILKFRALARLVRGDEGGGLEDLDRVIAYFRSQFAHVLRVLGASARAERALYFLGKGNRDAAMEDVEGIVGDLSLQKDVARFFGKEIKVLEGLGAEGASSVRDVGPGARALSRIIDKIPY